MSMDEEGIYEALKAFFGNDPYYPRPGEASWQAFRTKYLCTNQRESYARRRDRRLASSAFPEVH